MAERALTWVVPLIREEQFQEISTIQKPNLSIEWLLEHAQLSRLGRLQTNTLVKLLRLAKAQGQRTALQWDILMTNAVLKSCEQVLRSLPLHEFDSIRVQDLGAAEWLKTHYPHLAMTLIVETGNHNLKALQRWRQYFGPSLQRFVLSNELPRDRIEQYTQALNIPCELLAVGRILLYYSPRPLLSILQSDSEEETEEGMKINPQITSSTKQSGEGLWIEKFARSDEHGLHRLPLLENQHGTQMFHYYELFLLDDFTELKQALLTHLRLDTRWHTDTTLLTQLLQLSESQDLIQLQQLRNAWPIKTTHGFFRTNRTEKPLTRLKNKHLNIDPQTIVAHVIDSVKEEYIVLLGRQEFSVGETLCFITPQGGQRVEVVLSSIRNTQGEQVQTATASGYWIVDHVKYITQKSLLIRE